MKVGDLVRFKKQILEPNNYIGIVVAIPDSFAAEIYWSNMCRITVEDPFQGATQEECIAFLEVISESR